MDMEKIRQMAREQGVDLAVQGLVCLPREIKKYTGSIYSFHKKGGMVAYVALIQHKDFYLSKTFNTRAEAEQYIHLTNVREGLLKNRFIVFEDRVEDELTRGKMLICNVDNIDLIESHTWNFANGYAAMTTSSTINLQYFHNLAMEHLPSDITVNHINRNGLDNRKSNLRLVNQKIQTINHGCQVKNNSGVTGVCYKKPGVWVAFWQDADGNQWTKRFSLKKYGDNIAKAMAIKHRQRMIWSLPHYREALCLDAEI